MDLSVGNCWQFLKNSREQGIHQCGQLLKKKRKEAADRCVRWQLLVKFWKKSRGRRLPTDASV